MSELINNLQQIYNAKLAIKSAIGTQSDELADYAGYITALKPNGYTYLTENGSYNISAYEYAYVNVSSSIPEGYVLPTGTITCDSNGVNYDVKQYAYAYINVEGGGETIDPYRNAIQISDMIENGETEADYVWSNIMSNFIYDLNTAEWTETVAIDTGEVDGNNGPIFEDKNVRVILLDVVNQGVIGESLNDYPDLYGNIFPIIQNATLSVATGEDVEDGYDYLLEGELYAWNLTDMESEVVEITENGFYPSGDTCPLGFNVNVRGGGSEPENWIFDQDVDAAETEYTFSFDSATKDIIEQGTSESPVYLGTLVAPDGNTVDIKGYYDNGYWYVGDVDNYNIIDWTNGRQASDSDTIVLYSFENSEDSSVYDDLLMSLVSDGNGDLTGEVRIYVVNNYTSEEGTEEFSIGYEGGGSEPESYTLEGGLFINGQGQYYIADEGDLDDYINIIPKEDVTGPGFPNTAFSYLTVGKDTTITGYNYYNGDAFAIQAESYTQSSSIAYQTARLANIEPYLIKQYYGLGQYYDSAYITVNRSFNFPEGTQLGISREVFGYYFPIGNTNRYKDLMVDVSYITPAGDDILGAMATAMEFDSTTYALDLQNIRYCDDFMVYDNTYVTATTGIDGTTYYEIDLTQSGNYDDSDLLNSILSGGAFFADMPNGADDNTPIVHKLEVPGGTFVFDEANWVLLSNNEENTTGSVVFNKDHNNDPALYIDTSSVWWMDENGNWNITGVGALTVNGINSLKIRFYVDSSDNTWQYDWLIDVDYEYTPDEGGGDEEYKPGEIEE